MISFPFDLGCALCDHVATYPPTLDGIRRATAGYAAHLIMKHWEDLASKREEVSREDVH